jgi:hypothetical protein
MSEVIANADATAANSAICQVGLLPMPPPLAGAIVDVADGEGAAVDVDTATTEAGSTLGVARTTVAVTPGCVATDSTAGTGVGVVGGGVGASGGQTSSKLRASGCAPVPMPPAPHAQPSTSPSCTLRWRAPTGE